MKMPCASRMARPPLPFHPFLTHVLRLSTLSVLQVMGFLHDAPSTHQISMTRELTENTLPSPRISLRTRHTPIPSPSHHRDSPTCSPQPLPAPRLDSTQPKRNTQQTHPSSMPPGHVFPASLPCVGPHSSAEAPSPSQSRAAAAGPTRHDKPLLLRRAFLHPAPAAERETIPAPSHVARPGRLGHQQRPGRCLALSFGLLLDRS
ncbi:hypothetical protein J3F83DRAFT_450633 [Trichoderma novae-zelandiae]